MSGITELIAVFVANTFKNSKAWMERQIDEYRNFSHLNPVNRWYHALGIPSAAASTFFLLPSVLMHAEAMYLKIVGLTITALLITIMLFLFVFGGLRGVLAVLVLGPALYWLTATELLARNLGWLIIGGAMVYSIIGTFGLIAGKAANERKGIFAYCTVLFTFVVLLAAIKHYGIEQIASLEGGPGMTALVLFLTCFYYHHAGHKFFEGKTAVFLKRPIQLKNLVQAIFGAPLLVAEMLIGIFVDRHPYRVTWSSSSEYLRK